MGSVNNFYSRGYTHPIIDMNCLDPYIFIDELKDNEPTVQFIDNATNVQLINNATNIQLIDDEELQVSHERYVRKMKSVNFKKECLKEELESESCLKETLQKESVLKSTPITPESKHNSRYDTNEKKSINKTTKQINWTEYHRLSVIHSFLDDLEYDFPSICTVGVIGNSLEGRNLKILKVSNSNASNSAVWMDAGIHAREWIAPAVATYISDHIVRNFATLPASMTNKDWYFHPVVNPDGYEYSHTVDRMWRKNRAWYGGQCVGVDLNRNFSYGWGGKGSSDNPTNAFYRGPVPFSEPESCAIRVNVNPTSFSCNVPLIPKSCHRRWTQRLNCKQDILSNSGIPFKVYITLHSYGQVILFPFAYRDELCPDYVRLLEGATVMSKAIYESSGNTYKVGISRDVMYGAAGTSNDWSYGKAGIPYCYLIELTSKKHRFRLPKEEIEETGRAILNSVKALMEFLDKNSKNDNDNN